MKKLFSLFCLSLLFFSCGPSREEMERRKQAQNNNQIELSKDSRYINSSVEEYTYQGCEYIVVGYPTDHCWGAHKGNCKNPIHHYDTINQTK